MPKACKRQDGFSFLIHGSYFLSTSDRESAEVPLPWEWPILFIFLHLSLFPVILVCLLNLFQGPSYISMENSLILTFFLKT